MNAVRGLLSEFGIVAAKGTEGFNPHFSQK